MSEAPPLEFQARRDRTRLVLGLAGFILICWSACVALALQMDHPRAAAHAAHAPDPLGVAALFAMWPVMMAAMMVPTEVLYLLALTRAERRTEGAPRAVAAPFLAGYLLVWTVFSLLVALLQCGLAAVVPLDEGMAVSSPALAAAVLAAAGLFQFTPLKRACLLRCRDPEENAVFRPQRRRGAFVAGLEHGGVSLGSCGLLMLVPFAVGAMSLLWMVLLTGFLVLEKVVAGGTTFSRAAGGGLVAWAGWTLLGS